MKQEEKQLLLVDLAARLPYGVKIKANLFNDGEVEIIGTLKTINLKKDWFEFENQITPYHLEELKTFLRPMSSMTDEEEKEYYQKFGKGNEKYAPHDLINWLNAHHFDYRGLIEKGLALEAPEGMYNN